MIELARQKFPDKRFLVGDTVEETYDVVFEVMALSSFLPEGRMTPEQFYEKYKDKARVAVACFESQVFTIYPVI